MGVSNLNVYVTQFYHLYGDKLNMHKLLWHLWYRCAQESGCKHFNDHMTYDFMWAEMNTGKITQGYRNVELCLQVGYKGHAVVRVEYEDSYDDVLNLMGKAAERVLTSPGFGHEGNPPINGVHVRIMMEEVREDYPKKWHNRSFGVPLITQIPMEHMPKPGRVCR